jgi:hypothetical protein
MASRETHFTQRQIHCLHSQCGFLPEYYCPAFTVQSYSSCTYGRRAAEYSCSETFGTWYGSTLSDPTPGQVDGLWVGQIAHSDQSDHLKIRRVSHESDAVSQSCLTFQRAHALSCFFYHDQLEQHNARLGLLRLLAGAAVWLTRGC